MIPRFSAIIVVATLTSVLLCANPAQAEQTEITVTGETEFRLVTSPQGAVINGGRADGMVLSSEGGFGKIKAKDGAAVAAWRSNAEKREILNPSGEVVYSVITTPMGYEISNTAGELVYKVKLKNDGFSLYGKDRLRIARGGKVGDLYTVIDEFAKETMSIGGVESLRDGSYFALPLEIQYRVILWSMKP